MKRSIKLIAAAAFVAGGLTLGSQTAAAQEFTVKGDIVSSYVWRGYYQGGGAAFQPTLGFNAGGFSLTAWGSTNFSGGNKEIDLTGAYTFGDKGPTLSVASLWWNGEKSADAPHNNYFNFKSHETGHHFEAGLSYTLPCESFPLSIAWYTMFAGADKNLDGDQNYSSYVELNYPFSVKDVALNATLGALPYNSHGVYGKDNRGFVVNNIALKATKEFAVGKKWTLPVFVQGIWNPHMSDSYLVLGVTLQP